LFRGPSLVGVGRNLRNCFASLVMRFAGMMLPGKGSLVTVPSGRTRVVAGS